MFECKIPLFNPAPLRKEILESIRDLALEEQAARYGGYSDGILSGCGLFEQDARIGVTGGLVKFAGRVYVLNKKDSVPYHATESWTALKIRFGNEEVSRDFRTYRGELTLTENTDILPNEIELGRFKLKQGFRLRTHYLNFQDMETEYDTVHLTFIPFAGLGEPTLSPVIMMHFAREAYPLAQEAVDLAFCTACLGTGGVMSRESILLYLGRHGWKEKKYDNRELHHHLATTLAAMKGELRTGRQEQSEGMLLL